MRRNTIIAAAVVIIIIVVVATAAAIILSKPSSPTPPAGQQPSSTNTSSVTIQNFAFHPTPLTVSAGTTVTWTNNDTVTHTVTSTSGPASFSSGNIAPGGTYSFTFTQPGTYDYMCSIHTYMHGQVIVTSGGTTPSGTNQSNPSPSPAPAPHY